MATDKIIPDEEYVESVYEHLRGLVLELDSDPLAFGPKRLNEKIALSRKMLGECERVFLDVSQRLHRCKRAHRIAETVFDVAKKDLFANDPQVRAGRHVSEREALALMKLQKEWDEAQSYALAVQDLDHLMDIVKAKRNDLRDTQGRLRDQIRLCQEEVGLGSRWGSKRPLAKPLEPGAKRATSADVEDILQIVQSIEGETHLESEPIPEDGEQDNTNLVAQAAEDLEATGTVVSGPLNSESVPESAMPGGISDENVDAYLDEIDDAQMQISAEIRPSVPEETLDVDAILRLLED